VHVAHRRRDVCGAEHRLDAGEREAATRTGYAAKPLLLLYVLSQDGRAVAATRSRKLFSSGRKVADVEVYPDPRCLC
jgi:hypothetical protein